MRRIVVAVFILLTACQAITPLPVSYTVSPTVSWSSPQAILTPTSTVTQAATVEQISPSPTPSPTWVKVSYLVQFHPDGVLYVGDLISLEVIAPSDSHITGSEVQVILPGVSQSNIQKAAFAPFGIAGRRQATFYWVWDTRLLTAGTYSLNFKVLPDGPEWVELVDLFPAEDRPRAENTAVWETAHSQCCTVFYIYGTAAARDIDILLDIMDTQAVDAEARMNTDFEQAVQVILLPRVLGQGGFANQDIYISYLDRNYTAGSAGIIFHHEMIHILDARLGGGDRPSMFLEGLAVYMTGGHFKEEPLLPRAAALLETWGQLPEKGLDWYIPLETLALDFYHAQHEIGYLEAGALVSYMVERWGWEAFSNFYRDIHFDPQGTQAQAIHTALVAHFGLGLSDLDHDFQDALHQYPAINSLKDDVQLTVTFYDTVRRYQQTMDPSAYFSTAWLLDTNYMRDQGIVADYLRRPRSLAHMTVETMLLSAGQLMRDLDFDQAKRYLAAVNQVLDALESGAEDPFQNAPLARDYYQIVQAIYRAAWVFDLQESPDMQVEQIELAGDESKAWVSYGDPGLELLHLMRFQGNWIVTETWDETEVECSACLP
jgi:hypothetical protein